MNDVGFHCDAETYSPVDLKSAGLSRYISHPEADVLCFSYARGEEEPKVWIPSDPLPRELFDGRYISWNAGFERAVWWLLYRKYGWPDCPAHDRWECAQAVALSFALPAPLDQAAEALHVPIKKDPKGKRLIQLLCVPDRKTGQRRMPNAHFDDFLDMVDYCKQDVRTERAVLNACPRQHLTEIEHRRWRHQMLVNERGFRVDLPTCRLASASVKTWKGHLSKECKALTGSLEPTQRQAVWNWLREQNVDIANMRANTIRDVLKHLPEGDARRVLEIRAAASLTSTAKYDVAMRCVSGDSRVRYTQVFHGAGTGRVTHKLFQPGNMPRSKLWDGSGKPISDVWRFADEVNMMSDPALVDIMFEPMAFYSSMLRSMIVAPEGKMLFAGDYAQIEARMNAWQSGETSKLKAFVAKVDLYKRMAARIYGLHPDEISKDSRERQIGKSAELGAGFGLGSVGFRVYCKEQAGIEIAAQEAEVAIEAYRELSPRTVENWYRVKNAALNAIRDPGHVYEAGTVKYCCAKNRAWLFAQLPSGRVLSYCRPRIVLDKFGRPEQILIAGVHPKTKQWIEDLRIWHGLLVNNNVQGSCRDIMVDAALNLEVAQFRVVLSVHDEVISEGDAQRDIEDYLSIMGQAVPWAPGLPITVEGWSGRRYRKG